MPTDDNTPEKTPDDQEEGAIKSPPDPEMPIKIPARRLMKLSALFDAHLQGHHLEPTTLTKAVQYMRAEEIEQLHGEGTVMPDAGALGTEIDNLPWPPIGPPR